MSSAGWRSRTPEPGSASSAANSPRLVWSVTRRIPAGKVRVRGVLTGGQPTQHLSKRDRSSLGDSCGRRLACSDLPGDRSLPAAAGPAPAPGGRLRALFAAVLGCWLRLLAAG